MAKFLPIYKDDKLAQLIPATSVRSIDAATDNTCVVTVGDVGRPECEFRRIQYPADIETVWSLLSA